MTFLLEHGVGWRRALTTLAALAACSHTDLPTTDGLGAEGPFGTVSPIRLTFNSGQDLYPSFSEDGTSIIYTYQVPGRTDRDRCLGVLPAAGGSRLFEVCETRLAFADSTDVLADGALSTEGQLLFVQATSRIGGQVPTSSRLYLADTADIAARRLLLTMPTSFAGSSVDWLADVRWIADDAFLALGQQFTTIGLQGAARDTIYVPLAVARGTITQSGATLQPITGTEGATNYARSQDGGSIIFTRGGTTVLSVPLAGGTATVVATIPSAGAADRIMGLDCQRGTCIVLVAYERLPPSPFGTTNVIYSVPESGGAFVNRAVTDNNTWYWPRISPLANEFVLTSSVGGRDLYLFRGLY